MLEAAAPPSLSGLAGLLLRRPPSLRELVTLVGYADDYAWFAGLVRPPLSKGGGGGAGGPRRTQEGGALRQSLRGAALPPLRAVHRVSGWKTREKNLPGPGCGGESPSS